MSFPRGLPNSLRPEWLVTYPIRAKRTIKLLVISLVASVLYSVSISTPPATAVAANPTPVCSGAYCTVTFVYSGDFNNWTVPAGITSIYVVVQGASGGVGLGGAPAAPNPGFGAEMKGDVAVTPGNVLRVQVGGQGSAGLASYQLGGGGGGGASFISNTSTNPNTPLVVAGGGGGGAGACCGSTLTGGISASLTTSGTAGNTNAGGTPGAGGGGTDAG